MGGRYVANAACVAHKPAARGMISDAIGYIGPSVLPDGYHIERDADVMALLRADGSVVAHFSARGAESQEVERTALADAELSSHKRLRRTPARHARKPNA